MRIFKGAETEIAHEMTGPESEPAIVWAHGWGQSHNAFLALTNSFVKTGRHFQVDLPGFGASPPPHSSWGTQDYADAMAEFIEKEIKTPVLWVGHSFGCRVGIQLASRHPELVKGLFLIAAAGLPRRRPLIKKIYMKTRVALFKILKKLIPAGIINEEWLYKTFGSADYKNAGPMRAVFVKTVNEDLSGAARKIICPVHLVYGSDDNETPPEIGARLQKLISGAQLTILDNLDHYSVLGAGRHQVAPLLKKFMESSNA